MQQHGLSKIFAVSLAALIMAGCASNASTTDEAAAVDETTATEEAQTQDVPESPEVAVQTTLEAQGAINPLLNEKTVYFGFDQSGLRPEFKEILKAHAGFLAQNPSAKVIIEGHCDERGTVEYNLALGERRANAVRKFMIVNGAGAGQIESVSYGEERPAQIGSSDNAWSKNRRAEISYQAG